MPDDVARLNAALTGRYTIERQIGRGGMASVYLAHDLRHHREVAIKVLRPEVAAQIGAARFLREITVIARLQHPHILPLHDSGDLDGILYYVMPYVDGESLREKIGREERLSVPEAVRILLYVVDALSHAHVRGVVHRDIKPENVLLSGRHAWVADFGVAKALETTGHPRDSTAGLALGTPAYMSPEQAAADPKVDHRADLYAVGVLAYELLTGAPPFTGRTPRRILAAHLTETPEPVEQRRPDIPKALAAIIMKCLAKEPHDRWQTADELREHLEGQVTPRDGVTPTETQPVPVLGKRRGRTAAVLAGLTVVGLIGGAILFNGPAASELDGNLLAVAPFDVLGAGQELWREGLVDVLSASLDGVGPLRSVPPSVVINRWEGRADRASAERIGRILGAGLVVYGRLIPSGEDSVRLAASLFDVAANQVIGEVELRGQSANVDRLADSLALRLMSALGQRRGMGAVRIQSFGSSNPQALKAFLQGEHHYRRASWDSARGYYARAIYLDRGFALAYSRMGHVHEWRKGSDGAVPFALRAGVLNRGLAPRESLLITVDSIDAALYSFIGDTVAWSQLSRLYTTLEYATAQYPLDPGVWYRLGEARYHWGAYAGISSEETLGAFRRSVQLDSGFAPAYIHLIELTMQLDGVAAGRRAIEEYLALDPPGGQPDGIAFAGRLLELAEADSTELQTVLGTLSEDALDAATAVTGRLSDSAAAAVLFARATYRRAASDGARRFLSWSLAYRGFLLEAHALADPQDVGLYTELALLGTIPNDTASRVFAGWLLDGDGAGIWHALQWWAEHGEAVSVDQARRLWDSLRTASAVSVADTAELNHLVRTAEAYLALSAGDTAAALVRFGAIRTWPWEPYYRERLVYARLLSARGRVREAAQNVDQMPVPRSASAHPGEVLWELERARVHERLGNSERATGYYRYVAEVWQHADAALEPYVNEARRALARLTNVTS